MSLLAQACVLFTTARLPVSTRVCGSNSWEWVPASEQNPLCSSFVFQKMGKPMKFPQLWEKLGLYADTSTTRKRSPNLLCIYLVICLYIYHIFLYLFPFVYNPLVQCSLVKVYPNALSAASQM